MSESDTTNELSDEEQTAVAVEWYLAMWDEALKRGVAPETMVLVALSATTNKLSEIFGQEHASLLIKQTADNIASASPDEDTGTSGHS
ncbi:MAG: hypothetical protein CMF67_02910 [Magnetovibrio sp.]|nr:hypothetical protein [Magnetovibrio sp.]|tara:strand:+ start:655 stop:918 length:264 start_codon:yes stop_codon:yes gene_type:complete